MSTLAEPVRATQKHPLPVLTACQDQDVGGSTVLRSAFTSEGKLIETRERLPEYQYISGLRAHL